MNPDNPELAWGTDGFTQDLQYGYLGPIDSAPQKHNPKLILNTPGTSVLRILREQIAKCEEFTFSVAFVTPRAIALLKQELAEFEGEGRIITSNYLGFNSPEAFAELYNLTRLKIDVRLHGAEAFHPKGYIFEHARTVTTMVGSSNLTESALVKNHEWNLKVSALRESDLGRQLATLVQDQVRDSVPLSREWITKYAETYVPPHARPKRLAPFMPVPSQTEPFTPYDVVEPDPDAVEATVGAVEQTITAVLPPTITPNRMQQDALNQIALARSGSAPRALIISATGTGKTILSALDVRAVDPQRLLFVVHREQILDRTIVEYQRVLGGDVSDYGKFSGSQKRPNARYIFATVQTLSRPGALETFDRDSFDYVVFDEAHRCGSPSHRRVLDYFTPAFTLGMTATPERSDGFNVFELFNYVVPYEIRLQHALEEDMLAPFHYYGITDATFDDGTTVTAETGLPHLISPARVAHLIDKLELYGQAGVKPCGLIFCSSVDEAHALSDALNEELLHEKPLRTVALSGRDSTERREQMVERLVAGDLDYILTVDVFNEGVDIPPVNQVVMLRQTQSAIVFVQQLGRGLRKAPGKDYLVVIDFIGNYATNYLIPIALFGDNSLNKESLRQELIAAEESGVLPGLSSVRFDKLAQERVLTSISTTNLVTKRKLRDAVVAMQNRVGGVPRLWDFYRFESADPVVLATIDGTYPRLLKSLLRVNVNLTPAEDRALQVFSQEVLASKRPHEFVLLKGLLREGTLSWARIEALLRETNLPTSDQIVRSVADSLTLDTHHSADLKKYGDPPVNRTDAGIALAPEVLNAYRASSTFSEEVDDLLKTGSTLVRDRYDPSKPFTRGLQYTRDDVARMLCLPRAWKSIFMGYKADLDSGACPVFVTLHKASDITATTAYEDQILDPTTMLWYTRNRTTLNGDQEAAIVANEVEIHVFVKKDDTEGRNYYYLGRAHAHDAEQTTMAGKDGKRASVVRMHLRFEVPIDAGLYDYFHPTITS
ncbi:DEAD/DEAH box helicase [Myceligenerans crystallogenes]|uniref:DUF3427 domain-containing protein n=1 Tax=Myceligenerans crystallogenes TaxID=316335 RepID=A0ABP4ZS60_9MICO